MVQEGDVYYDNTFEDELKVVEVDGDSLIIDDYVSGNDTREYRKWELEHNISVGRFEKVREENIVGNEKDAETEQDVFEYEEDVKPKRGIFDY
jgi:hypothetical protein